MKYSNINPLEILWLLCAHFSICRKFFWPSILLYLSIKMFGNTVPSGIFYIQRANRQKNVTATLSGVKIPTPIIVEHRKFSLNWKTELTVFRILLFFLAVFTYFALPVNSRTTWCGDFFKPSIVNHEHTKKRINHIGQVISSNDVTFVHTYIRYMIFWLEKCYEH